MEQILLQKNKSRKIYMREYRKICKYKNFEIKNGYLLNLLENNWNEIKIFKDRERNRTYRWRSKNKEKFKEYKKIHKYKITTKHRENRRTKNKKNI